MCVFVIRLAVSILPAINWNFNQKGYEILLGNNVLINDKDYYLVAYCGLSSAIRESGFHLMNVLMLSIEYMNNCFNHGTDGNH